MKHNLDFTVHRLPSTVHRILLKISKLAPLLALLLTLGSPMPLFAQPCHPLAGFNYTINGCDVSFQPYANGPGITHFWTFKSAAGFPSSTNVAAPTHTFGSETTNYIRTVTHTVTIAGAMYSCTKQFSVYCTSGCDDRWIAYMVNGCTVNFYDYYHASSQNWDFGDGGTSNMVNPSHTYAASGDYTVTYTNSGTVCQKTIRVNCDNTQTCCTAAFTGSVSRECSQLKLSLNAECTGNGTHLWTVAPNVPNACMTLNNFFQGMPVQGAIQVTNINTCIVDALIVTHRFVCPNGTVHIETKTLPILDDGIFIGKDGTTTLLTDYNCVLPGSVYNGPCTVYSSGIVTVDKDFTFTSANVRVQPGLSGFDVIRNFTLNQNTVVSGNAEPECNCLWRGINVYAGITMATASDASIQDALYAIRAGKKSFLDIKKTLFVRNYVGIRSTEGPFTLSAFEENRFDGQGPLKEICSLTPLNDVVVSQLGNTWCDIAVPYQSGGGFAGMYIRNAGSLNLPSLVFAKQNLFYRLAAGIDAYDTDLTVIRDSRFENILPNPAAYDVPYGGVAIRYADSETLGANGIKVNGNGKNFAGAPDINNCTVGIYLNTSVPATVYSGTGFQVTGCRILQAHHGVYMTNTCVPGTFTGSRDNFYRGLGDNYIEVNPSTGNLYELSIGFQSGITLYDWDPAQSAPEFWQNTIDVNQDVPCGSRGIAAIGINFGPQIIDQVDINRNQINLNQGGMGILLGNYSGAWVHDNSNAGFPGAGIFLNYQHLPLDCFGSMSDYSQGISISSGFNNLVGCNDVTSIPGNFDLFVRSSQNGTFVRNNLTGGRYCARFGANNAGGRFACNTMTNYTENGLYYANVAVTGPQGATMAMTHGNVWSSNNPALTDAFIDLANTNPASSRYFVRMLPGENPSTNTVLNAWFTANIPNNISPTCYYDCPITAPQAIVAEITTADDMVAADTMAYRYFPEASKWIDERNLLEKLAQNPSLVSSSATMQGFVSQRQNSALARLVEANSNIRNLFALSEEVINTLSANGQTTQGLLLKLGSLDSLTHTGLEAATWEAVQAQRDSLTDKLSAVQVQAGSFAQVLAQQQLNGAPAVLADLESIAPSNVFEWNEQKVLQIYLQTYILGGQPDEITLEMLYNIGKECPLVNGPSVYNARSLYEKFTGIVMPDVDCPVADNRLGSERDRSFKAGKDILMFPNPADEVLTLSLPTIGTHEIYRVSIANVLGKQLLDTAFPSGERRIFTDQWPSGMYMVRISLNDLMVLAAPVFIQH